MRMRHKKNLESRLEACGHRIIFLDRETRDLSDKSEKHIIDLERAFGRLAPLELEIGCGKGQFACELAKRQPDVDLLAAEVSSNVIVTAAEAAIAQDIPNLRFLRGNAVTLDCFIPEHSVRRIYLNFSCPYPKNTYSAKRLTSPVFLELYKRLLTPEGEIFQKTDNMHFFEYSIEQLTAGGFKLRNVSLDLHNSGFEGNIVTEYEQKFLDEGKPIYRLEAYL